MDLIIDRINTLLMNIHMPPVRDLQLKPTSMKADNNKLPVYRSMTPAHDLLDIIDKHVGIGTRNQFHNNQPAPVGERVRRLERHMNAKRAPPYFWLGSAAEELMEAAPA